MHHGGHLGKHGLLNSAESEVMFVGCVCWISVHLVCLCFQQPYVCCHIRIDSSVKYKHQLGLELWSSCIIEGHSNLKSPIWCL